MNKIKLASVIVTYNRSELLKQCIKACINQTYMFDYILVVNNASSDNTREVLIEYKNDIHYINLSDNIGGSGGFYEGMKYFFDNKIDFDYLLLIDDDAILDNKFNDNIVNNISDKYKAYSGTVLTGNKIQLFHRSRLKSRSYYYEEVSENEYNSMNFECELASFCGLFINKDLINKIGFPNKDFFIWEDDKEYSLRIIKYSKVLNVNSAIIDHRTIQTEKYNKINWKTYYYYRNRILIIKYHYHNDYASELLKELLRGIKSVIVYIFSHRKDNLALSKIHFNVFGDVLLNKLGKNTKYLPGVKL